MTMTNIPPSLRRLATFKGYLSAGAEMIIRAYGESQHTKVLQHPRVANAREFYAELDRMKRTGQISASVGGQ